MTDDRSPTNGVAPEPLQAPTLPPDLSSAQPSIPPLPVAALLVRKSDLVASLRLFVPQLVDVGPLDASHYLLSFHPLGRQAQSLNGRSTDALETTQPTVPALPQSVEGDSLSSSIPPLPVAALVVRKEDLVGALRLFVAQLVDLAPLDLQNYLLSFHPLGQIEESKETTDG